MTENEQRILALIAAEGPMSKRDLAERGTMAWATVVKYVNRLEKEEILRRAGTSMREQHLGKNSYLYELSSRAPRFLGIDIEYQVTRMAIVDLGRRILWQSEMPTPEVATVADLGAFLAGAIRDHRAGGRHEIDSEVALDTVVGVGVGMPRWLVAEDSQLFNDPFAELGDRLSRDLELPVNVENNIRAYTLYKEPLIPDTSFLVVSVRNGIGVGIVSNGVLHRGETGFAGEIGHITVDDNGTRCRCGKRGCLETVVNQRTLCERYYDEVCSGTRPSEVAERCLPDLFARAARADEKSVAILSEAAEPLGRALASLVLVLDIQNIYLVGRFGSDGAVWLHYLERVIRRYVDPGLNFSLHYRELDDEGYLLGAALLVARNYLDFSVVRAG